jgi:hypothetical protein
MKGILSINRNKKNEKIESLFFADFGSDTKERSERIVSKVF